MKKRIRELRPTLSIAAAALATVATLGGGSCLTSSAEFKTVGWERPSTTSPTQPSRGESPLYVGVGEVCNGEGDAVLVTFSLASVTGHVWADRPDEGRGLSAGSKANGIWYQDTDVSSTWTRAETQSGGEGHLRAEIPDTADLLRVIYDGWVSAPAQSKGLSCGAS